MNEIIIKLDDQVTANHHPTSGKWCIIALSFGVVFSVFGQSNLKSFGLFIVEPFIFSIIISTTILIPGQLNRIIKMISYPSTVIVLLITSSLFIVGIIFHGNFKSAYQDYRALLIIYLGYVIIRFFLIKKKAILSFLYLFVLSSNSLSLLQYYNNGDIGHKKLIFPVFNIILTGVVLIHYKKKHHWLLLITPLLIISLFSGYRIQFISLAWSIAVLFTINLLMGIKNLQKIILSILVGCIISIIFVSSLSHVERLLKNYPVLYGQLWIKTEQMINDFSSEGNRQDSSSQSRLNMLSAPFDEITSFLMPHGLGAWAAYYYYIEEKGWRLQPLDNGFLALSHYLSTPVALLLLFLLGLFGWQYALIEKNNESLKYIKISMVVFCLLYIIFVSGTIFAMPIHSFPFGVTLGFIFTKFNLEEGDQTSASFKKYFLSKQL